MKLTIKCMLLGLVVAFMTSCGKPDRVIYNGDVNTDQTLLQFEQTAYAIDVDQAGQGSLTINILASTHADNNRTFDIEFVADDILNGEVVYTFDNTVTIPANKYIGSFNVDVTSSNLTNKNYTLQLRLVAPDSDNIVLEKEMTTITFRPFNN